MGEKISLIENSSKRIASYCSAILAEMLRDPIFVEVLAPAIGAAVFNDVLLRLKNLLEEKEHMKICKCTVHTNTEADGESWASVQAREFVNRFQRVPKRKL